MLVAIRPAVPGDAPAIRNVALESWPTTYHGIFTPDFIASFLDRNYNVESLEQAIAFTWQDDFRIFDAAIDERGRVVGFLQMSLKGDHPFLWRLYVLPSHQRQGIGLVLLTRLEDHLRSRGNSSYGLLVHSQNEIGKAFYLKHRFVHQPQKDEGGEWFMEKVLNVANG